MGSGVKNLLQNRIDNGRMLEKSGIMERRLQVLKKLIVGFLTLAMLFSLTACGGSGKTSGAAATQAPVATPALATPPARS